MNSDIFHLIHLLAGQSKFMDSVIVFSAKYLIFALFVTLGILGIRLIIKHRWAMIVYTGMNLVFTFAIARVFVYLYESNRPFVDNAFTPLIKHAADQSFPSDHAVAAFAVALSILVFMRHKLIGSIAIIVAFIIGIARVAAGVHYPLDIAGSLVAAVIATGVVMIIRNGMKPSKQSVKFKRPDRSAS
ncbi:MAG: phosphatase PAP2 family protein [Candidatus Saccharimonadales bacterium]